MNQFIIAPSILSADLANLKKEVDSVLTAGADWIHIDVMDYHYVPNLTFGPMICRALRKTGITAFFDVHLMTESVDALALEFIQAGANLISFHPEATHHPHRTIQLIKSQGSQVGVALNPATPISILDYLWEDLDVIMVMSVNPGFGGQSFIPSSLEKLNVLKQRIQTKNPTIRLEIDGGVKPENIQEIAAAGADTFVAGSAIFSSPNYTSTITKMRKALSYVR